MSSGVPTNLAFLGLGSNIHPERNLPAAVQAVSTFGAVPRISQVWQSAPVGFHHQPDFLNAAVLLRTPLTLAEIRTRVIPGIEFRLQRRRDPRNKDGPRTIDVDICLFNDEIHVEEGFRIPDPDILERLFLALPLSELSPHFVHPETGQTLQEIARSLAAGSQPLRLRTDVPLASRCENPQDGNMEPGGGTRPRKKPGSSCR